MKMYKNNNIGTGEKISSVICKEVFDDGYQPLSEGTSRRLIFEEHICYWFFSLCIKKIFQRSIETCSLQSKK